MLSSLFANSNPDQRAGILNQLVSALGPAALSSGALSNLGGLLRGGLLRWWLEEADDGRLLGALAGLKEVPDGHGSHGEKNRGRHDPPDELPSRGAHLRATGLLETALLR
jgi:hypothetical protein